MTARRSLTGLALVAAVGCSSGQARVSAGGDGAQADVEVNRHSVKSMRIEGHVCDGIPLRPDYEELSEKDLIRFLRGQGFQVRTTGARSDIVYLDVDRQGEKTRRLRVAILKSAPEAGFELHEAMLQHGPGSWGVHRSNLAILAPIASTREILRFAKSSKLACWGVLTLAGRDDTFVVRGGYMEL